MTSYKKRSNVEWISALQGSEGGEEQVSALGDLANYLHSVAYNKLQRKREDVLRLQWLHDDEIIALAEEFMQQTMEKVSKNDFALLDKYSGHGPFLSWAAQVTNNLCRSELRRKAWHTNELLEPKHNLIRDDLPTPETAALRDHLNETIAHCLDKLPVRYRVALAGCLVEGQSASAVAETLETSANAVHLLVHRGKKMMQEQLAQAGIEVDILALLGCA